MDARQLRIGNYVTVNSNSPWTDLIGKTVSVTGIQTRNDKHFPQSNFVVEFSTKDESISWHNFAQWDEFMSPIPLTEQWLVDFGGVEVKSKSGLIKSFELIGIKFDMSNSGNFYHSQTRKNIPYVHKLQNFIYELKDVELTINNL